MNTLLRTKPHINKIFRVKSLRIGSSGRNRLQFIRKFQKLWGFSKDNNMVITQATGMTHAHQYYFRNTRNSTATSGGVLIVPRNKTETALKKIVVAWDEFRGNKLFISQFYNVLSLKETEIIFVYVNKMNAYLNNINFPSLKIEIQSDPVLNPRIQFDAIYVTDEEFYPEYMNIYMRYMHADLLVIDFSDKNRLRTISQIKTANKSQPLCNYPLYIRNLI